MMPLIYLLSNSVKTNRTIKVLNIWTVNGLAVFALKLNQRTNGPVNAHLICGPTIITKTSFSKFDNYCKIGQGQRMVVIYINCVELEFIILHAKYQDHRTSGSGEDF